MSKLFKNLVKVTPLVLGASVAAAGSAVAQTMPGTPQLKIDPAARPPTRQSRCCTSQTTPPVYH